MGKGLIDNIIYKMTVLLYYKMKKGCLNEV